MIESKTIDKVMNATLIENVVTPGTQCLCGNPLTTSKSHNIYHCPSCKRGGNAINFLMGFRAMSFEGAVKHLASKYGEADNPRPERSQITQPKDHPWLK